MKKELLKFLMIVCFIILLICVGMIFYLKKNINTNRPKSEDEIGSDVLANYGKTYNGTIDYYSYFDVKKHMQKYIDIINIKGSYYGYNDENGKYIYTSTENQIKQKIYNLLSDKYIKEKGITLDNLYNNIKTIDKSAIFVPIDIVLVQEDEIKSFLICGLIEDANDYTVIDRINVIINIDLIGCTYSVEPLSNEYTDINEIKIDKLENTIIENEDNTFYQAYVVAEDIPAEYIQLYKEFAIGAPEKLYSLLQEDYRYKKFQDLEEFKQYIERNKEEIIRAKLDKFQIQENDGKIKYICVDTNKNYYIINQNEALSSYNFMLDLYTIDLPEFIEEYNKSKNNEKLILNLKKLKEAIKNDDYKYVYYKLNSVFAQNNYPSVEEFEKFVKNNYNIKAKIEYLSYEEKSEVYTYKIKYTNQNEEKEIYILMKLLDNREFEFSFNIKK